MSNARGDWMAWARLARLPNVFTAVADPMAGWWMAAVAAHKPAWQLPVLMSASALLYMAGMILNDCFDLDRDRRLRPERVLPMGLIAYRTAWGVGWTLLAGGVALAGVTGGVSWMVAGLLALCIVMYNAAAKHHPVAGPVTMGGCRSLNMMLGMGWISGGLWLAPVLLGLYVAGVSVVARSEAGHPSRRQLITRLLQGIVVVDAVLVVAMTTPSVDWLGAMLVLMLLAPVIALSRAMAMT